MPVSLTNSNDIVANSVSIIDYNNVVDIMELTGNINNIITYIIECTTSSNSAMMNISKTSVNIWRHRL